MTDERSAETAAELEKLRVMYAAMVCQARDDKASLRKQLDEARTYAENLAVALSRHYPHVPQWKPLSGDLIGLLTQIDNMTACLVPASPSPVLRDAVMVPRDLLHDIAEFLHREGLSEQGKYIDDFLATTGDRT